MPTTSPEIAVKTSRAERVVSDEGEMGVVTVEELLRRKLIRINHTPLVAKLQLWTQINHLGELGTLTAW
jgi:hypothetical protein